MNLIAFSEIKMTEKAKQKETKAPSKKRVEVYTKVTFDKDGIRHNVGEVVTSTDEDYLAHLTERDAIKTKVI